MTEAAGRDEQPMIPTEPATEPATAANPAAFALPRYQLAPRGTLSAPVVIETFPQGEAAQMGEAFAAIDPRATYAFPAAAMRQYFETSEPGAPRFRLMSGDRVAGAAGLRLNWLRGPYIQFLALLPGMQRQGIGTAVLAWIEGEARSAGERNLWIAASAINRGAIQLYERLGFRDTAWLDDLVCDGHTEILMRKRLV
jgi:GNAT superfamily N-acetyltransferase